MIQVVRRSIVDVYNRYSFNRQSLAYDSKGRLYHLHNARFEPGKFAQAVLVEEGTENKIATPTTFAGWANFSGGAVLNNDGSFYPSQAKFARVSTTAWGFQSNSIPAANGQTWSVSYIARRGTGDGEPRAAIMIMNASNTHVSNINPTFSSRNIGGGWVRYEATFTINYADTGYIRLQFYVTATNGGYHDFALPQLEQKPYATSFIDGTRAADNLSISPDVINLAEGEIELTVIPQIISHVNIHFEANAGSVNKNQFMIWKENIFWRVGLIDKDGTNRYINLDYDGQVGVPTDIKLKWKNINSGQANAEVRVIINGVVRGRITGVQIDMDPLTVAYIGRRANSESYYGNALYDDLRISNIYRADEDDIAAYESNQPLPVDQYTTLKLGFDGPDGQRPSKVLIA